MAQSLARNAVHLVFSTKNREPILTPGFRDRMFVYLAGALNAEGCRALAVGGVADHVHLLFLLARTVPLCGAAEFIKTGSSKWAKANGGPAGFYWQNGYGAFSVSPQNEPRVAGYIARQEEHHAGTTFQDEMRLMLTQAGVAYDERYMWE